MFSVQKFSILLVPILASLVLFTACSDEGAGTPSGRSSNNPERDVAQPTPTPAVTANGTPEATATPWPTPLPTIRPTPTATALPIALGGDPRSLAVAKPTPQDGAACGVVDILDFPLDPPDAEEISSGGQDFGRFRRRYDGYHAGEDWWGPSRRNSFGQPVHSIGHGRVTYAHPYGWGADQGVVIIRHVFSDGRTLLSFYGHLDPPSVTLSNGDCVERGELVGEIGRPRTSPHLHFEIRTHTPDDPGPGYWSTDPALSGWLPPSETIWGQRIGVSPGVEWTRSSAGEGLLAGGLLDDDILVAAEASDLVGLALADGSERWRHRVFDVQGQDGEQETVPVEAVALDLHNALVYAANGRGTLVAFALPVEATTEETAADGSPEAVWDITFHNLGGSPTLIPLPQGGVAYTVRGRMIGLSPAGALLWRSSFEDRLQEWIHFEEEVLVSTSGSGPSLWSLSAGGLAAWEGFGSGSLLRDGTQALLYDGDGVHRLDLETRTARLLVSLPDSVASQGDITALPGGGILVSHRGRRAHRLIELDAEGRVRWERSFNGPLSTAKFVNLDGEPFLIAEDHNRAWSRVALYAFSRNEPALTWLFVGGTRSPQPDRTWTLPLGSGRMLLHIGGGSLVALNLEEALQQVCQARTQVLAPSC